MAHLKSAIKRLRTSTLANARNRARTSALKTAEKKFRAALETNDSAKAFECYKECCSKLDKAAKVGIVHRNKVANKKSQFDKLMNALQK